MACVAGLGETHGRGKREAVRHYQPRHWRQAPGDPEMSTEQRAIDTAELHRRAASVPIATGGGGDITHFQRKPFANENCVCLR